MNNRKYDILKFIGSIVLPATATLVVAVGKIWGFAYAAEVSGTLTALAVFLNAILKGEAEKFWKDHDIERKKPKEISNKRYF